MQGKQGDVAQLFFSTKDLCPNFITKATKLQSSSLHQSSDASASTQANKHPSGGVSTQGYTSNPERQKTIQKTQPTAAA
jgi:hypothetical protein